MAKEYDHAQLLEDFSAFLWRFFDLRNKTTFSKEEILTMFCNTREGKRYFMSAAEFKKLQDGLCEVLDHVEAEKLKNELRQILENRVRQEKS